ncbi:hypothetical protein Patl1_04551 [Pistacia atlantica]|uniref:Uncharacterized protein n=1 Tax=Pistacia atlantica TaxID=434234 RepID=A0ACC1BVA4_9ROSI|nr:hypothetical protein Patl1_04551 [Pistacia atlantica]
MGILDYISSTCDSIKRNAPNPSSVKHLYWSSYDYSRAAVTKIHNVFPSKAVIEKLNQHLPDEDTRYKIAENLAKNSAAAAVQEGLKFVPGGPILYDIVNRSLRYYKKSNDDTKILQELEDKLGRMDKELSDYRKLLEQTEIRKPIRELDCRNTTLGLNQKPEDVIRIFMMTEFVGDHLLDNLIVPGVRSRKPNMEYDQ